MKIFRRQDSHKKKRVNPRWRSARGLQSKIRLAKKGYMKKPKIGYGAKKKTDKIIQISSLKELDGGSIQIKKGDKVMICSLGLKKKIDLIKKANKMGITVINVDANFLEKSELKLKERKEKRKKKGLEKSTKEKEAKKKAEEKNKKRR